MPRRAAALLAAVLAAGSLVAPAAAPPARATTLLAVLPGASAAVAGEASQIVAGSVDRTSLALTATYAVDVRLTTATRALQGTTTITLRNDSGGPIDRVELNTVMPRLGGMRLGAVTVDGAPAAATVDDQTIVVPLGGILPAGASATVHVPFSATLRASLTGSNWLFTRVNGVVNLYRWIPWISRRTPFDRPNHGDPFVTPVSPRAVVTIRTDVPLRIAGTGRRTAISADGRTQTITADQVRDVVLTLARDYRWLDATVGDTRIRVATRPGGNPTALMNAAKRALTRIEALLGPYPYPLLTIAQSAGGYGMEGPGVVWIPPGTAAGNLPYLVAHEVAHQWFYALVGNDQAREPFADEAAADMVARHVLSLRRASRCSTAPLDRSIYRYGSACYYEVVYIQGGNLLDDARRRMGNTAYWNALRRYLEANRFGLSSTRALLEALDSGTSRSLADWWGPRFPAIY